MGGRPVANMFSAYGGIRWESGLNRQMQYEKNKAGSAQPSGSGPICISPIRPCFIYPK